MFRITTILAAAMLASCSSMHHGHAMKAHDMGRHEMMRHGPHVVATASRHDFDATLAAAKDAIDARGFKTFAVIDHAKGAASIGADLRPTTLIIFGNPKGGTPLIQAEQRIGLELPLKLLVLENEEGGVEILHEDMTHLFHEYGVSGPAEVMAKIGGALSAIAAEAAGE